MSSNSDIEVLLQQANKAVRVTENNEIFNALKDAVNHLLQHDFSKLLFILYKVDVSEAKLKQQLSQFKDKDAAAVIARLLIDRQLEKQKSKASFKPDTDIPESDKW